ncbi:MAG: hypothetical protein LQ351_005100 [Letrouitia transgressa]|nr:MAG: hypothetical protein LQ351_005100 [Letrouitia transgressa]
MSVGVILSVYVSNPLLMTLFGLRLAPVTRVKLTKLNSSKRLPLPFPLLSQRRTAVWDAFRPKKREIFDPLDPNFLKRKPEAAPPQAPPRTGDITPNSIFEDERKEKTADPTAVDEAQPSATDSVVMAAALDPNPRARKRWQRKMVIREVRNRGHLTKAQQIARTEREHVSKSAMLKTSVKKLSPLARQIADKPIEEAIIQMRFSKKKAARDVKKHLEYARDQAIVTRGMGLGKVQTWQENDENKENLIKTHQQGKEKREWSGMIVEDRKGKRRFVDDRSSIYVDEAWVGRGTYEKELEYRARGHANVLRHPETSKLAFILTT